MRIKSLLLSALGALVCLCASAADYNLAVDVHGTVKDVNGKVLPGVVVSDGFTATITDQDGKYAFKRHIASNFVFCSLPSEYEVPIRQGQPVIYKKLDDRAQTYDFILTPMKGGKEKSFSLFLLGDPQSQNIHHVDRLRTEAIPDIKAYARKQKGNCYAITLGDIGYTEGGRNTNYLLPIIRNEMTVEKAGMPIFQTVGNHDFEFARGDFDANNPTVSIRRDRMFEAVFGPVNYSWNRGDVHFVAMNDVKFENFVNPGKYTIGISDEQLEWLRQDLSYVSKNKLVILTVHIPIYGKKDVNCLKAVELLGQFDNAVIMSGHTHTNYKSIHSNGVREYTVGALSGCWWWSRNCADGSPNGYLVCHIEGNDIKDHIYKATGFKDSFQMRIYRGDAVYGGSYEKFPMQYDHNTLLVNVWNWDKGCSLQVYENGKLTETLTAPMASTGEFVPVANGTKDWWAIGYNVGVVGRGHKSSSTRNNYCSKNYHMFRYDIKDPSAKIKMVFSDSSGRHFTETHIFETSEYENYAEPPAYQDDNVWLY